MGAGARPDGPTSFTTAPSEPLGTAQPPTPSPQGPGPAQAKAALGAILRTGAGGSRTPPGDHAEPSPTAAAPASEQPGGGATSQAATIAPAGETAGGAAPTQSSTSRTGPRAGQAGLPTRDQLTKAWGDSVITKLSKPAQVYMGGGRFIEADGPAAVFALPDRGLLQRAENFVDEAQNALTAHFGLRVPLRLVVDRGAATVAPPTNDNDDETYDLDDLGELRDAPAALVVPPEQRVLEAFPGSVLDS